MIQRMEQIVELNELKAVIKKHEQFKPYLYRDTSGKLTIGWGRNLESRGISVDEAELMFENDFVTAINDLKFYRWYIDQPKIVQYALIDMCFNLGIIKLLGFKKMIQALHDKDYRKAALEVLDSKYASQVRDRAKDNAIMIREGLNAETGADSTD